LANGSVSVPSLKFASSTSTGIFSPETGKIALASEGNLFLHNKGVGNTALGASALALNTTIDNTALGSLALASTTTGGANTAVGSIALRHNTNGIRNIAVGAGALFNNTTGFGNTAVGYQTLFNNAGGSRNIALGESAGSNATSSNGSIFIGNIGLPSDTAVIRIGVPGSQSRAFIAGIRGARTGSNNVVNVVVDSNGQLGTISSSRRYKEDIAPMPDMTAMLQQLRPVTFRYKQPDDDGSKPIQYGLIAEEVAEVLPDLTVFNEDGRPETVKYHLLPSFLLAGYQQQQKRMQAQADEARQQRATIDTQASEIAELKQRLLAIEAMLPRVTKASALQ
jgi:hypothetical protein